MSLEGSDQACPFGSLRVEARIHDVARPTSTLPVKSGGYSRPVKTDARRETGIAPEDGVSLELL
ncbi:MAG TPA: DUF1905 domain-containing protein [Sphingomicrobium sp.]|jgi:hypothetical protein|nr:DUF1905 domain-containing protein [Sphingomicrobium sp.]